MSFQKFPERVGFQVDIFGPYVQKIKATFKVRSSVASCPRADEDLVLHDVGCYAQQKFRRKRWKKTHWAVGDEESSAICDPIGASQSPRPTGPRPQGGLSDSEGEKAGPK